MLTLAKTDYPSIENFTISTPLDKDNVHVSFSHIHTDFQ